MSAGIFNLPNKLNNKGIVRKKILSVGHVEFPDIGQAQVQRQLLMAKAIILEGFDITILCRYGIHSESDEINIEGIFEGVHYVYCSGTSVRPKNFFRRTYLKFRGMIKEAIYYKKFSINKQLAGVLVSTNSFHNILFYFFLGKIFKVITVVDNVEYWTSKKNYKGLDRIDKFFYDKFYFLFVDKIICISDFLISKIWKFAKNKVIKIPVITDFEKFSINKNYERVIKGSYFLFCGSEKYFDVIDFVISAFEKQAESNDTYLVLVTKSSEEIKIRFDKSRNKERILIYSNIPYSDLINLYCNSEALIIPMRNTDQDKARFPHKISEYCASARPIITNGIGEINNYFNYTNAYLCPDYDEQKFADAMQAIISDPDKAKKIAMNSYLTGMFNFNYKSYSKKLADLFINI